MLDRINDHYSFTNPASIFDEEAMTALELAGRTAHKMNEAVNAYNKLETETNKHLDEQDKEISTRLSNQDSRLTTMEKTQIPNTVNTVVDNHIQNGTFDMQINEYAGNLEARLDNLLGSLEEGGTTSDAELIDLRVGANTEVYESAGKAVRRYEDIIDRHHPWINCTNGIVADKAIIDDGTIVDSEGTSCSDFIRVINGSTIHLENVNLNIRRAVYGYDNSKNPVKCLVTNSTDSTLDINIPITCHYIRACGFVGKKLRMQYKNFYEPQMYGLSDLKDRCNTNFNIGDVVTCGTGLSIYKTHTEYKSFENHCGNVWLKECEDVELLEFKVTTTKLEGVYQPIRFFVKNPKTDNFFFVTYTVKQLEDGTFTKGGTAYWFDKSYKQLEYTREVEVTSEKIKNAIIGKIFNVQVRIVHGYVHLYIEGVFADKYKLPITGKMIAGYNFRQPDTTIILNDMRVVNRKSKSPYMHISIDDVTMCLADINSNKNTYVSIFDNPFLAKLREWHLKYGAVFSLYVFNTGSINLANMTAIYNDEFKACADWLKFGVHSEDASTYYNTYTDEAFVNSYTSIRNSIINFSGYECIDNIPRLGFFSANKPALKALRTSGVGFLGALTADDERESNVGLDVDERSIVNSCDSYFDLINDLHFIRTTRRLDGLNLDTVEEVFNADYLDRHNNDVFEIFLHETDNPEANHMLALGKVIELANQRGIRFAYHQDEIIER